MKFMPQNTDPLRAELERKTKALVRAENEYLDIQAKILEKTAKKIQLEKQKDAFKGGEVQRRSLELFKLQGNLSRKEKEISKLRIEILNIQKILLSSNVKNTKEVSNQHKFINNIIAALESNTHSKNNADIYFKQTLDKISDISKKSSDPKFIDPKIKISNEDIIKSVNLSQTTIITEIKTSNTLVLNAVKGLSSQLNSQLKGIVTSGKGISTGSIDSDSYLSKARKYGMDLLYKDILFKIKDAQKKDPHADTTELESQKKEIEEILDKKFEKASNKNFKKQEKLFKNERAKQGNVITDWFGEKIPQSLKDWHEDVYIPTFKNYLLPISGKTVGTTAATLTATALIPGIGTLATGLLTVGMAIKANKEELKEIGINIKNLSSRVFGGIKFISSLFKFIFSAAGGAFMVVKFIGGFLFKTLKIIGAMIKFIFTFIKTVVIKAFKFLFGFIKTMFKIVIWPFKQLFRMVRAIFSFTFGVLVGLVSKLEKVYKTLTSGLFKILSGPLGLFLGLGLLHLANAIFKGKLIETFNYIKEFFMGGEETHGIGTRIKNWWGGEDRFKTLIKKITGEFGERFLDWYSSTDGDRAERLSQKLFGTSLEESPKFFQSLVENYRKFSDYLEDIWEKFENSREILKNVFNFFKEINIGALGRTLFTVEFTKSLFTLISATITDVLNLINWQALGNIMGVNFMRIVITNWPALPRRVRQNMLEKLQHKIVDSRGISARESATFRLNQYYNEHDLGMSAIWDERSLKRRWFTDERTFIRNARAKRAIRDIGNELFGIGGVRDDLLGGNMPQRSALLSLATLYNSYMQYLTKDLAKRIVSSNLGDSSNAIKALLTRTTDKHISETFYQEYKDTLEIYARLAAFQYLNEKRIREETTPADLINTSFETPRVFNEIIEDFKSEYISEKRKDEKIEKILSYADLIRVRAIDYDRLRDPRILNLDQADGRKFLLKLPIDELNDKIERIENLIRKDNQKRIAENVLDGIYNIQSRLENINSLPQSPDGPYLSNDTKPLGEPTSQ